ncbi:MAG: glutamine-hydrolyzing GMP synthase [Anaerolineae bacterium]|jgi:GMP synthase (glutamine-hydrolysing)|nr:glutamine-hydrolyzing GMP synthase [Anaerolineae bacterium]MBT4308897.1 glutamine-hydrolyzing GMP synthase [Anaerolineae bacterium]MBT4459048.1 glutamine-hydrolyzing GMP synthase [Anaerolineae bacterium]MBT6060122.1 glutamine-hydrolyzing GMP synthase [Anaerolineae bacterium]MBT6320794.1 glutamine-hydrolyzing GMP synthase [Anaerolineae bacterium]
MTASIAILDFGSQYAQIIARRVRENNVYCELFPFDAPAKQVLAINPRGFILSGGPASVYAEGAPQIADYILDSGLPILGICYGMQALTHALGGQVDPSSEREFGVATVKLTDSTPLLPTPEFHALMSHGDRITRLPEGFISLAKSGNSPVAAMGDLEHNYYGVQFHPEVHHTPSGSEILRRFAVEICNATPNWTAESIIESKVEEIRQQVGDKRVLSAVSGGVDSSVATALVHRAIGDQLVSVYVDTGLMRENESAGVVSAFREHLGAELIAVDAEDEFLGALVGVTDPEEKRRAVGEKFIRIFEEQAKSLGQPKFLVQGTIYPDVVESSAPDRNKAEKIKSHHNVGGLPEDMEFALVEPLRYLFKDEVRAVGEALGLAEELVWRQPFPGPGLTIRCLGEVTKPRVARLRKADAILREELRNAGMIGKDAETSQAFAVLLNVRSVGVMGDSRTYEEAVAIRAVTTEDFMTAEWTRIPHEVLAKISSRIVNEVEGINRVVYDITGKPPGTIEWE